MKLTWSSCSRTFRNFIAAVGTQPVFLFFFRQIMQGTANIIDAPELVMTYGNIDVVCIMRLICTAVRRTTVIRNCLPAFRYPLRKGIYFFNPLTIDPENDMRMKTMISRLFNHPEETNDIFKLFHLLQQHTQLQFKPAMIRL